MFRRCICALTALVALAPPGLPQTAPPNVVFLQVTVSIEGESHPTDTEITVASVNEWGETEAFETTRQGVVQFPVKPGLHRLRVTGPEIEQYDDELLVDSNAMAAVAVQVRRKRPLQEGSAAVGLVPAVRLKIPRNAEKLYKKALEEMERQELAGARAHLLKAVETYPEYDLAWNALATLELKTGRPDLARRHLEKAIALNNSYADACRKLAAILLSEHSYAEARFALERSLRAQPGDPWALSYLALVELLTGRAPEAVQHAQKVHTLAHSGYASAHLIAAQALENLGRTQDAIAEYRLYLVEDPSGPNAARAREAWERLAAANQSQPPIRKNKSEK